MNPKLKKLFLIILKFVVTITVFYWVLRKLGPEGRENLLMNVRNADPLGLAAGLFMFIILLGIGVARWQILLRIQGIHLSTYRAIWITAAGTFFNAFLMGATGGDVLKAWYAAEAAPHKKPEAVLSIAIDRLIGLLGLFVLATIAVLLYLPKLMGNPSTSPLAISVLVAITVSILGLLLTTQRHHLMRMSWWPAVWARVPFKAIFSSLSTSYDAYGKYPIALFNALLLSVGVHVCGVLAAWFVGGALGIEGVRLLEYFIYCPIINAISAIPISVGGLGLREQAFAFFFALSGVPSFKAVALSLLFYSGTLVVSLSSGILFLVGKPKSLSSVKTGHS
jgi:glycosyltransferase 2 family protein